MKDPWNPQDGDLVMLDKITETGMSTYWDAVDLTFCFNKTRREQFVAKNFNKSTDLSTSGGMKQLPSTSHSTVPTIQGIDPMIGFFNRNNNVGCHMDACEDHHGPGNRNVEFRRDTQEDWRFIDRRHRHREWHSTGNRFLLPQLKNFWH